MATTYNGLQRDETTGEWIDTSQGIPRRYNPHRSTNPRVLDAEKQYQRDQVIALNNMPSAAQVVQINNTAAERQRQAEEQAQRAVAAQRMGEILPGLYQRREAIYNEITQSTPVNPVTGQPDPTALQERLQNSAAYNEIQGQINAIEGWREQGNNAAMFNYEVPPDTTVDPDVEEAAFLSGQGLNIPGVESQTDQAPSERVVGIFNSQGDGPDNLTLVPEQQAREEYARLTGELEGATREEREANARERGTYDRIIQLNRGIRDLETRVADQRNQEAAPERGFTAGEIGFQGNAIVNGVDTGGRAGDGRSADQFARERGYTRLDDGTYQRGFTLGGIPGLGVMQQLEQNAAGMQPVVPPHEGPASGTYQAPDGSFVGIGANQNQGGFATEEEARQWSLANLNPQPVQPDPQSPPVQVVQTGGSAVEGTANVSASLPSFSQAYQEGGMFGPGGVFNPTPEQSQAIRDSRSSPEARGAYRPGNLQEALPPAVSGFLFGPQARTESEAYREGRDEHFSNQPPPPAWITTAFNGFQRAPEGSGVTAQRPPSLGFVAPSVPRNLPQVDPGNNLARFLQNQQGNQAQASPPDPRNDPNFNRSSLFMEGSPLLATPRVAQRPDPFQSGRAIAGTSSR